MGTDIHFYIEKKEGNDWKAIGTWGENAMYDPECDAPEEKLYFESPILIHRSYPLFSVLANVRNEQPFLSLLFHKMGLKNKIPGFVPIDTARWLPNNLSDDLQKQTETHCEDCHSHSWLSLNEIIDYNWDQNIEFKKNGEFIKTTPRENCSDFLEKTIPEILKYGKPQDIRCVFWFDN